jgi:hypothetical protein
MGDWSLVIAPGAAVLYFLFEPDQFNALVGFLEHVIH